MVKQAGADKLLKDLNKEQTEAVTFGDGPLLIVAGAGTGKTTVVTKRIAWLIEQKKAAPDEILALTFTEKAATEMEERVDRLMPMGYVNLWVSTFHSFADRVLKDWGIDIGLPGDFKLLNTTEQWLLVKQNLDKFDLDYYRPLGNPAKFIHALLKHFSRAKDEEVYPEDYLQLAEEKQLDAGLGEYTKRKSHPAGGHPKGEKRKAQKSKQESLDSDISDEGEVTRLKEVAGAYHVYQKLLLDNNALDFGDLINYCLKLFRKRPQILDKFRQQFKYILVDEFQDTNYAQYELIKLLAAPQNNITVVGDDDQSIFKFRGASISNILEFKKDFAQSKEIFLTTNYRSTQNILDLSYKFIQLNNPYRLEVKLRQISKNLRSAAKSSTEGLDKTLKLPDLGEPSSTGVKLKTVGKNLSKKLIATSKEPGDIQVLNYTNMLQEATGVINKIIDLKNKDKEASWNDFAILVRANSSAEPFINVMRRAGLPYEYVANRGLYQEPVILNLVAYFKLLDNYHESRAMYRVLNTDWYNFPNDDLVKLLYFANKKSLSIYEALSQAGVIPLSAEAQKIGDRLRADVIKHTEFARTKTASETYLRIIRDIGVTDWLVQNQDNYEVVKQANYLTAFFKKIQQFELDNYEKNLFNFLQVYNLELESGEEGELPAASDEGPEMIKVITVHSAKGLEFKYVFVVQMVDRRFPSTERREQIELPTELIKEILPEGDIHLQEERRLFYVAMTRAKQGLYFSTAQDYFGKQKRKPSRFLFELEMADPKHLTLQAADELKDKIGATTRSKKISYVIPESFSFTSISSFLKCPLEYKYRFLLKIPEPGAPALTFGSSMHKALEQFMKLWQTQLSSKQMGLFGANVTKGDFPIFKELEGIYHNSWSDDWYDNKKQLEEYKKRGLEQIKTFYDFIKINKPRPKYLEQFFKLRFGDYKFVGKIDRMDISNGGVKIIDYKTGESAPKSLAPVDKEQLLVYQLAAQDFFQEKVVSCQYWYLNKNVLTEEFLGTAEELADLRNQYIDTIEQIVAASKADNFFELHRDHKGCKYEFLD